jgi:hypothetical protein
VFNLVLDPVITVPPNHYFRAIATAGQAPDGQVSVEIGGYLAAIV